MEWIDWKLHPVPEDVRGILIKYEDGVFADRYDYETKKRKYREGKEIIGWRFMERGDPNDKSILCSNNQEDSNKNEDQLLMGIGYPESHDPFGNMKRRLQWCINDKHYTEGKFYYHDHEIDILEIILAAAEWKEENG